MTLSRSIRLVLIAAVATTAGLALPARADDPPVSEAPSAEAPDLPAADAVLDAMPSLIAPPQPRAARRSRDGGEPTAIESTGAVDLRTPPLGERPTPREALESGELGRTIMRPRGGSATAGKPDVPPER